MPYTTLISPADLAPHLNDPAWVVFDCRHALGDHAYGERVYRQGHLPGARYADVDTHLAAPVTPQTGRHPLPDMNVFADWLGGQGVDNQSQVVAYDDSHGAFAARLWWMLRHLGHDTVAVLDGGFARWQKEGRPVTAALPEARETDFVGAPQPEMLASLEEVEEAARAGQGLLVDARAAERFRGESETLDAQAGHIPGAVNLPFARNLGPDGAWLAPQALRQAWQQRLGAVPPEQSIHYCGSGVSACHNLLALAASGLPLGRLYVGSWSQWSKLPGHAVETGPERASR